MDSRWWVLAEALDEVSACWEGRGAVPSAIARGFEEAIAAYLPAVIDASDAAQGTVEAAYLREQLRSVARS